MLGSGNAQTEKQTKDGRRKPEKPGTPACLRNRTSNQVETRKQKSASRIFPSSCDVRRLAFRMSLLLPEVEEDTLNTANYIDSL